MIPSPRPAPRPHGEPLSGLDAFFLYLESPRTPLHSGSVAIFEGGPLTDRMGRLRIEAIRTAVERRLHLVPKLRRRVVFGSVGEVAPLWVDDQEFDISRHIRRLALPAPGDEQQLADLAAGLMEVPIDLEHPLWELWFVEGLEGGRIGLVQKLHHALADGIAGVELATVLLDLDPRAPFPPPPARPWRPSPVPNEVLVLGREVLRRSTAPLRAMGTGIDAARHPLRTGHSFVRVTDSLRTVAGPRIIAPRSSLNQPIGRSRRLAFVRQSMSELKLVEQRFGVTLNDILLSAVAGGVQSLYASRGESSNAGGIQVLVPVGVPHHGEHSLGNQVSAMIPRLTLAESDPVMRLGCVAKEMSSCKAHHQAIVGEALVAMLDRLPQIGVGLAAQIVHHQPFVNMVVTNVPGVSVPLYAMGARMLEAFPIVPLAGNLSAGVAALSYGDHLAVGIIGDRDRLGDIDVLANGIRSTFSDLVAAGARTTDRALVA
jgi:diacylglycerol O-acyltransferase